MGLWTGTGTFILQARRAVMNLSWNVILLGSRESGQADSGRKEALIDGGGGEGEALSLSPCGLVGSLSRAMLAAE